MKQLLEKALQDTDSRAADDLRQRLEDEMRKPAEQRDYALIRELSETCCEMMHVRSDVEAASARGIQAVIERLDGSEPEEACVISVAENVRPSVLRFVPAIAACIVVVLGFVGGGILWRMAPEEQLPVTEPETSEQLSSETQQQTEDVTEPVFVPYIPVETAEDPAETAPSEQIPATDAAAASSGRSIETVTEPTTSQPTEETVYRRYDPADYDLIERDGIYYDVPAQYPDRYHVWGIADKDAERFTIPQEIDGRKVLMEMPDSYGFSDCKHLKAINIEGGRLDDWYTIDGVLFRKDTLMYYPSQKEGDYTIPEGTKKVAQGAFLDAGKLGKLSACSGLTGMIQIYDSAITEFDGRGMESAEIIEFWRCPALKTVRIDGTVTSSLIIFDDPELEHITFTQDAEVSGECSIAACPKLRELRIPGRSPGRLLHVAECDALEYLSFCNSVLGADRAEVTMQDGEKVTSGKGAKIEHCAALKQIEVLAVPDVTSHRYIVTNNLPALEKVTFYEKPGEPDAGYAPLIIGDAVGQFTVAGYAEHTALRDWCARNGYRFELLNTVNSLALDPGDAAQIADESHAVPAPDDAPTE
ncbi:MAG: hypothetical protein K5695_01400 [Oscillospiraceae bacterium]|nr:hypothetical protein [Oscillospiraceae bacterium]